MPLCPARAKYAVFIPRGDFTDGVRRLKFKYSVLIISGRGDLRNGKDENGRDHRQKLVQRQKHALVRGRMVDGRARAGARRREREAAQGCRLRPRRPRRRHAAQQPGVPGSVHRRVETSRRRRHAQRAGRPAGHRRSGAAYHARRRRCRACHEGPRRCVRGAADAVRLPREHRLAARVQGRPHVQDR